MAETPPACKADRTWLWVTCLVLGVVGVLVLLVIAAAVGIFVLGRSSQPIMEPVAPTSVQGALEEAEASEVTPEEALRTVGDLPEVAEWMALLKAAGKTPVMQIEDDHTAAYTVHLYEEVEDEVTGGYTATFGWYQVSKQTGEVKLIAP